MKTIHATKRASFLRALIVQFVAVSIAILALGQEPEGPPPQDDPSKHTGPWIDEKGADDLLRSTPKVFKSAYEGGEPHGRPLPEQSGNIPTGGIASPLFGATEFEQQFLRFEEFGPKKMQGAQEHFQTLPLPESPTGFPEGGSLDSFLSLEGFSFLPSEFSNTEELNPWQTIVESFLGRPLQTPPAEGRPPGVGWAHQRWDEFLPEVYFKTAQTGARINGGLRNPLQRHNYQKGEFAPGGLYHTVYATDGLGALFSGTTEGINVQFHPNFPIQDRRSLWTFDGTFPPKLLMARYGEPVLMRHYNALPIDPAANNGFGLHTITTHEHNGHNPAESDGVAGAFYFPGQFWDYRWPMTLAGYDTVNTTASDPRAAFPAEPGEQLFVNDLNPGVRQEQDGRINIRGDWRETMSTHWFHDHMIDHTAENVYKGNAAMFNYYSAVDRGNEGFDDGVNLRFPSGTGLSWGNRDYDVNILVADKAWDADGQLFFNPFDRDGFLGDQVLTNFLWKPYLNVRHRSYRLRILNGAVARYFKIALVKEVQGSGGELSGPPGSGVSYDRIGFHMIANDGNILEHAVPFDGISDLNANGNADEHKGMLPSLGIAERYDIIVDFASQGIVPGDKLYFVNTLEHDDGRGPDGMIPLSEILSGQYVAEQRDGVWVSNDPAVGKFLEFRVTEYDGEDLSMNPADYVPGAQKMIPLPIDRTALGNPKRRTFEFGRGSGTDNAPWTIKTDGGPSLLGDPRRVSAAAQIATGPTAAGFDGTNAEGYDVTGTLEIWNFSTGGGWDHPVHVHFEEGVILSKDGERPPVWEWWARKDLYRIGPSIDSAREMEIAMRIREFAGTFVEHCHNTTHEDHAMLLRWDSELPGQVKLMPTPVPSWDGVEYVDTVALPTFRSGVNGPELPENNPFVSPVIDSFTGTSENGESVLSWSINQDSGDNILALDLSPGVGSVLGRTSTVVNPSQTTIYRLTARTPGGTSTATITVSPDGTIGEGDINNGGIPGDDLLTNGDFEAELDGWTFVNSNVGSTEVVLDSVNGSSVAVLNDSRIHRSVPVEGGQNYIFSIMYRNEDDPSMRMSIEFFDASGGSVGLFENTPTTSVNYRTTSVRGLAPAEAVSATISFASSQPGLTYVDNAFFAVEELVEPELPARYRINFSGLFNSTTHPDANFPADPKFSKLLAATHAADERIWAVGELASGPVVTLAETGSEAALAELIDSQVGNGFGGYAVSPEFLDGTGSTSVEVQALPEFPILSLISQISPSPDWFTGLDSINLKDDDGNWISVIELDLYPLDAGSDSGTTYGADDLSTIPRSVVTALRDTSPFSSLPVGRVTISLVNDGPVIKGDNLLANPGFEDEFTSWETFVTVNGSASITTVSANGLSAAELNGALVYQGVPVEPEENYELAVQYFSPGAAETLVGIEFFDASGNSLLVEEVSPSTNSRYESVTVSATAPEGSVSANVYFWSAEGSVTKVDDFDFHTINVVIDNPEPEVQENSLKNGGFENRFSSWNRKKLFRRGWRISISRKEFEGRYAASIKGGMIYQNVSVKEGAEFSFSGKYISTHKKSDSEVGIAFFNASGKLIDAASYKLTPIREYTGFAISGEAPEGTVSGKVYVVGDRRGRILIDDLVLNVVSGESEVPQELLGPTVRLTTAATGVEQPFTVNVIFSENISGLELSDFIIANGVASGLSTIAECEYFVTVTPAGADAVRISLPSGAVTNDVEQPNRPSNTLIVGEGGLPEDPGADPEPQPESLKNREVPEPSNLSEFIRDKEAAIELGKALFWDMQVGSNNSVSCATCHFHAGADNRIVNQVSPGLLRVNSNGESDPDNTFQVGGPNYEFKREDFPFHKLEDVDDRDSEVISSVNDIASSQGVFLEEAGGLKYTRDRERNTVIPDDVFHVGVVNTRRVEPRNTPTVINSIFNLRNFWDGRAQDTFNGVNPFGGRDQGAYVWKAESKKKVEKVQIRIDKASLASQAVGPPLSNFEMSATGRRFPELGRKLLNRRPLDAQLVHRDDSVLGKYSRHPRQGMTVSKYSTLVKRAFHPEWWQGTTRLIIEDEEPMNDTADAGGIPALSKAMKKGKGNKKGKVFKNGFTHMEANFSLYFGLAIQLYEATLVSDDTPFDRYVEGDTTALTAEEQKGMDIFFGKAKCASCHGGAEFTKATVSHVEKERLERMIMGDGNQAVYDNGFYNIGVRPTFEDLGVGGSDPFGFPLSESRLAEQFGSEVFKEVIGDSPNLSVASGERIAADGAFKTPTLRNIELTAPYFHNGGTLTLMEVVEFYNRGGDFHDENIDNLDPDIESLGLSDEEKKALVAFMKSLTDERVRTRRAPFDHPQLIIPNGHKGDETSVEDRGNGTARDNIFILPATGKEGGEPLPNFLE
ncbi:MAG: cytochrome c peroxidase [Verrucomicrobiales bacterium]|nr:cytochrome c peroxidase [Verrucomicrobiales bacterium]